MVVTGHSIVCSLQGIVPEIQSPALSKSVPIIQLSILTLDHDNILAHLATQRFLDLVSCCAC